MLLTFIICYFRYLQLKSLLTPLLKYVHEEDYGGLYCKSGIRRIQASQEERTLINESVYNITERRVKQP